MQKKTRLRVVKLITKAALWAIQSCLVAATLISTVAVVESAVIVASGYAEDTSYTPLLVFLALSIVTGIAVFFPGRKW